MEGAHLLGFANGTARGMGRTRVADLYKVFWDGGFCQDSYILAGIDKAIDDNVNIMSLYLSGPPEAYYKESIFIATFSAIERWIFVSCSAVNWSLPFQCIELRSVDYYKSTVGAGTIDRDFPVLVIFGNGKNYTGVLLFKGDAPG